MFNSTTTALGQGSMLAEWFKATLAVMTNVILSDAKNRDCLMPTPGTSLSFSLLHRLNISRYYLSKSLYKCYLILNHLFRYSHTPSLSLSFNVSPSLAFALGSNDFFMLARWRDRHDLDSSYSQSARTERSVTINNCFAIVRNGLAYLLAKLYATLGQSWSNFSEL